MLDAHPVLPEPFHSWFASRGWAPRRHQLELLAHARAGRHVLLTAPTGGGKTLAGFLPSLIELSALPGVCPLLVPDQQRLSPGMRAAHVRGPEKFRLQAPASPDISLGTLGPGQPAGADFRETARDRRHREHKLHTLYVSPLKALAVDVARNLVNPASEMGLKLRIETRTGDTPQSRRIRQRAHPPDILLTTPEQLELLVASENGSAFFGDLRHIIMDEVHALAPSKRGDQLSLALAAIQRHAPGARRVGLSATVRDPALYARWLVPQAADEEHVAALVVGDPGAPPDVDVLISQERVPWAGHTGGHAMAELYERIRKAGVTLVFVNTRAQAELTFQWLWQINDDNLPIALHHGSLDVEQRRRVEAAMVAGRLRAIVATSTLDMGIDWGDVDLVIQLGAPKGSSRLLQRIGRANHRLDEPSRALLVPYNRFEALECDAAKEAVEEGALDGEDPAKGALDVLAQHVVGRAIGEPFTADELYAEVRTAAPYAGLERSVFDRVLEFASSGGYALRSYDRFRKLVLGKDGRWRIRNADFAARWRLNVGTIVEAPMLSVRLAGKGGPSPRRSGSGRAGGRPGRKLGEIEEYFIEHLSPGDTFVFAGEVLEFVALQETDALVNRTSAENPKVPSYEGGKFPLSTYLAARVRARISSGEWDRLPEQVREWLEIQRLRSLIPGSDEMLIETFPRGGRFYMAAYPFEGRLAHQTLGMLLTRRLDRAGLQPLGFVATEYALAVHGLRDLSGVDFGGLFSEDMLRDDLDAWLQETPLMKRTFRKCAVIAGLIERRWPGMEKTGRQVTFSSDLIYDVLRRHEPDHILLQAAYQDAGSGLLDLRRLGALLARIRGRIVHAALDRLSPLAVPLMVEIGRESVHGDAAEAILATVSEELIEEATRL